MDYIEGVCNLPISDHYHRPVRTYTRSVSQRQGFRSVCVHTSYDRWLIPAGLAKQASQITMYDVKSYYNQARNAVLNVSEMEAKVREATNDDPWSAPRFHDNNQE